MNVKNREDQHWSARHLPAKQLSGLPKVEDVVALFKRPSGTQRLSSKSTCLFPSFAQYLTDGIIRTRMPNTSAGETELEKLENRHHRIAEERALIKLDHSRYFLPVHFGDKNGLPASSHAERVFMRRSIHTPRKH
jgi:hypothetical protein